MKKIIVLLVVLLSLCGCTTEKSIEVDLNAGPDITELDYTNIKFNIYHTTGGKWILLHTFDVCPDQGNYVNVVYRIGQLPTT